MKKHLVPHEGILRTYHGFSAQIHHQDTIFALVLIESRPVIWTLDDVTNSLKELDRFYTDQGKPGLQFKILSKQGFWSNPKVNKHWP